MLQIKRAHSRLPRVHCRDQTCDASRIHSTLSGLVVYSIICNLWSFCLSLFRLRRFFFLLFFFSMQLKAAAALNEFEKIRDDVICGRWVWRNPLCAGKCTGCQGCVTGSFANIHCVLVRRGTSWICAVAAAAAAVRGPTELHSAFLHHQSVIWKNHPVTDVFVRRCFVTHLILQQRICLKLTGLPEAGGRGEGGARTATDNNYFHPWSPHCFQSVTCQN